MRVSEVYASVQGEGPNVGKTTVFVRFGGCNLRCPGWPCDTPHAIFPDKYRKEWKHYEPQDLYKEASQKALATGADVITLTGGEPFLQPKQELFEFVGLCRKLGFEVDCFSNGTLAYPEWAGERITFIVDWKLTGSGEADVGKATRITNLHKLNRSSLPQAVKFVCKNYDDLEEAYAMWDRHIYTPMMSIETFYGRVWESDIKDSDLAEWVMSRKLPWRLNRQEHNYIWPANERGR